MVEGSPSYKNHKSHHSSSPQSQIEISLSCTAALFLSHQSLALSWKELHKLKISKRIIYIIVVVNYIGILNFS